MSSQDASDEHEFHLMAIDRLEKVNEKIIKLNKIASRDNEIAMRIVAISLIITIANAVFMLVVAMS